MIQFYKGKKMYKLLIIVILLLFQSSFIYAKKMNTAPAFIFASGNLQFVFPQIIKKFYKTYPNARVFIQYGSSGYLSNMILQGKSYDIFFSANVQYPEKIYTAKKSATEPKVYTQGTLILFVPTNISLSQKGLNILNSKKIKNITIANKSTAPYGVAAIQTINNSKLSIKVKNKIRYSSDIATAIDNVIWHGDAGFLSKSALIMLPDDRKVKGVDWIEIKQKLYQPIIQAYVVSKHGLKNDNAIKFLHFIESKIGQDIFLSNGYKSI